MTYRHFKYEGWLYSLAFLLALGLRLTQLGLMPLTDAEAGPALQALRIAQGSSPALSPHPLYILSTSILFFLYGNGTDFLSRLLPAIIGSLLVFAPLLFDTRIKPRPGLTPRLLHCTRPRPDSTITTSCQSYLCDHVPDFCCCIL
jgi:predicted membrane-bound mannosyltransferase